MAEFISIHYGNVVFRLCFGEVVFLYIPDIFFMSIIKKHDSRNDISLYTERFEVIGICGRG